jgi:hypothetical protein
LMISNEHIRFSRINHVTIAYPGRNKQQIRQRVCPDS